MINKFKKKTILELDLSPPDSFVRRKSLKADFNSESEKKLLVDPAFLTELYALSDIDNEETLKEIRKGIADPSFRRNLMRYGLNISIDEKVHWALTLLSRASRPENKGSRMTGSRMTISKLLENYINSLKHKNISKDVFLHREVQTPESEMALFDHALLLNRILYCGNEKEEDIVQIFIPEITYHPIPLLRYMLLFSITPELCESDDKSYIKGFFDIDRKDDLREVLRKVNFRNFKKNVEDQISWEKVTKVPKSFGDKPTLPFKLKTRENIILHRLWERSIARDILMIEALDQKYIKNFIKRLDMCLNLESNLGKIHK